MAWLPVNVRTIAIVALLASTLLAPRTASALSAECLVGFDGVGAPDGGIVTRRACDGACTFTLRLCTDVLENGRPCHAGPLHALEARQNDASAAMGRPEPGSPGSCGETLTVRLRPAGDRAARWSVRVRARGPARQRDRDRLVLRCLPNATKTGCDAGNPPTPTVVTTSTLAAASTTTTTRPEDCPNAACPTVTTTSVATTSTTDTTLPPDKTCDVSPVMCCQTPLWCSQLVNDGSSDEFRSRCPGVVTPGSCPTSCGAPSACCRVDDCATYELRGEDDRFDDAICRLAGGVLEAGACTDSRGGACRRTGCSGQLCLDRHVSTTCQWYPYYACLHDAECARQPDIGCAWTATDELRQCLEANGLPSHPFP